MSSNSGGDGTVEMYSTLTDLEAVKLMDFLRKVNYTKSLDDLAKEETWHWNRGSQSQEYGLDDDDMVLVGKLIEKLGGGAANRRWLSRPSTLRVTATFAMLTIPWRGCRRWESGRAFACLGVGGSK